MHGGAGGDRGLVGGGLGEGGGGDGDGGDSEGGVGEDEGGGGDGDGGGGDGDGDGGLGDGGGGLGDGGGGEGEGEGGLGGGNGGGAGDGGGDGLCWQSFSHFSCFFSHFLSLASFLQYVSGRASAPIAAEMRSMIISFMWALCVPPRQGECGAATRGCEVFAYVKLADLTGTTRLIEPLYQTVY